MSVPKSQIVLNKKMKDLDLFCFGLQRSEHKSFWTPGERAIFFTE